MRNAGRARSARWAHGLSVVGTGRPSGMPLPPETLEQPFGATNQAVEAVGILLARIDDVVEEALTLLPDPSMERRERLRVPPRPLPVREVDRSREDVRKADGQREHAGHEMDPAEPEGEWHAAIAGAVAGVEQPDEGLGDGDRRLIVCLVASNGGDEDDGRVRLEREA